MSLPAKITVSPAESAQQSGVLPDVDYGPRLSATTWSLTAFAALFLGLRIFSKFWRSRSIWWDDHVLIASWLALAASCSLLSVCVSLGYGRHNWDIPAENFDKVLLYSYAAGFTSILAAMWSKISFAITLLRITKGRPRALLWFIIASVTLVLGASATIHWVQCWPLDALWLSRDREECLPRKVIVDYNVFVACYSGFADIALALFPWFIIWASTISKKEKLGVVISMSMGVFAGVASFLKITTVTAIDSNDVIDSVELLIYGTAESASTIMAVSIPMLRALIREPKTKSPQLLADGRVHSGGESRNFSYPSSRGPLIREEGTELKETDRRTEVQKTEARSSICTITSL